MVIAMVALWVTVLTGVVVFAFWYPTEARDGARFRSVFGATHVSMASLAVVAWTTFAIGGSRSVGVASVTALGSAVLAGLVTVVVTRRWERTAAPPDAAVPLGALAVHGVVAAAAVFATLSAFVTS